VAEVDVKAEQSSMGGATLWPKIKLGLAGLLALLMIVLVLQNTEVVETKLLFMTVEMPRAALLLVSLLIGVVIGMILAVRVFGKAKVKGEPPKG